MAELKGSKTEKNLLAAFAGESQAHTKYQYYASKAKKDGYVKTLFARRRYLPELALLWRVMNNIDLFCCMLRKEWIWDLLAALVNYAEAAELFMLDYINRRSLNMLMKVLQEK